MKLQKNCFLSQRLQKALKNSQNLRYGLVVGLKVSKHCSCKSNPNAHDQIFLCLLDKYDDLISLKTIAVFSQSFFLHTNLDPNWKSGGSA